MWWTKLLIYWFILGRNGDVFFVAGAIGENDIIIDYYLLWHTFVYAMTRQNRPNIGLVQARLLFWFDVFSQRVFQDPVLKLLYFSLIAGRMHTYFSSKMIYIYMSLWISTVMLWKLWLCVRACVVMCLWAYPPNCQINEGRGFYHPTLHKNIRPWASYQIRKIACCACTGNAGNVFPATDFKGQPLTS